MPLPATIRESGGQEQSDISDIGFLNLLPVIPKGLGVVSKPLPVIPKVLSVTPKGFAVIAKGLICILVHQGSLSHDCSLYAGIWHVLC